MKTQPNDSAYPEIQTDLERDNPMASGDTYSYGGLTKREYFAAMAMQGLMANPAYPEMVASGVKLDATFTDEAVAFADALIAELNKESK